MEASFDNRRSIWNALRVEEEFTSRQIMRVAACATVYIFFTTFLLCVYYLYVLHPSALGRPSMTSMATDLSLRWNASPDLRNAIGIWLVGMGGMSALFACATGLVFSKKLAGPIHRLKSDLTAIADGAEPRPVILRDGDELQDLAEVLNRAVAKLTSANPRSAMESDARDASLESIRGHVDELKGLALCHADGEVISDWLVRMLDLLDKADSTHEA